MRNIQTAVSPGPIENWTHVYMNLFTRNSPYYQLLKYLIFLLKHPVYREEQARKFIRPVVESQRVKKQSESCKIFSE